MKRILVSLVLLATGLPSAAAFAHSFLDHAVPAVGATIAAAPRQVQLFFTQQLEPAFSGATITGADGTAIAAGAATIDPRNPNEMVLTLPVLAPGRYKIRWHALSVDTHRTEGSFGFDIQP